MQLSVVFATVASALFASAHAQEACGAAELLKLLPLANSKNLAPCQEDSEGWQLLPPSGYPNQAQLDTMCKSDACLALFEEVQALNPSMCSLTVGGNTIVVPVVVQQFTATCPAAN